MSSTSIVLRYPSAWLRPVHRDHALVRRDTQRWLHALGVLDTPAARRTFEVLDVGRYGGLPFAFASPAAVVTVTRFLALWSLHDELLEGSRVVTASMLVDAIAGVPGSPVAADPHVRGWQQLGQRLRAAMSDRWMQRHTACFERWLGSVDAEAGLATQARATGILPSFERYMEVRLVNIGVAPVCSWIEHALGYELDPAVLADPDLAEAERLAARIVTFQNDIAGLGNDVRNGWPNAVRCIASDRRVSIAAAIQHAVALHDADVAQLVRTCERLAARHGLAVRWWAQALGWVIGGLAQWHAGAERYADMAVAAGPMRVDLVA